jgi:UDP-glucose 4-epimerase
MKVAITGVSGYLGGLLLRQLAAEPTIDAILGLDLVPPAQLSPKLTFQIADVRTAPFDELLRGVDVLFHLAFIVQPPPRLKPAEVDEINIGGSRRVFEGAAAAGVRKIIHASSVAAYGAHADNPTPLTEDSPLRPNENWYYSRTKGAVERFLDEFQPQHPDVVIVRFRPSIFLGPTVNNSIGQLFETRVLVTFDPKLKMDLCWDEDIADAFCLALRYDRSDVFNLTGGAPISMIEAGAIVGKRVWRVSRKWVLPLVRAAVALRLQPRGSLEWLETGTADAVLVSAQRARERLGWQPRFDSAGALRKFVESKS